MELGGPRPWLLAKWVSSASSGVRLCPWGLAAQEGNLEPLRLESCFEHTQPLR